MAVAGTPWQHKCERVGQRCGYLLTSGLWSDCIFMVGSETNQEVIQAHKFVLAMASPVFEGMFYGELSERNDPTVTIPDVQPEAFRALLQYIYTGIINIGSFDMACDLWYGARKYMLPHLEKECNRYSSVLGPKNACRAYEFACLFDNKTLMDKCMKTISQNTKEVLNDCNFVDVELNTLIAVFSLDHLNVDSELDLFHAAARYAEAEQRRQAQISPPVLDSEPTTEVVTSKPTDDKENLKEDEPSIHAALQKIRFLSMSVQEFAEGPARSGLLTKDECLALLINIASRDGIVPVPTGFSECWERRQPPSDSEEQSFKARSLDHTINALKIKDPSHVKDAARAADNILHKPPRIEPALDKGILDALGPALTEGNEESKLQAVLAVSRLCAFGFSSQLHVLAASAALQPYCRLLAAGGDTCYYVLVGLTNLLKNVEQNTKIDLLPMLREIGVPQLLISVQQDEEREHRECANSLLQTYFSNEQ